MSSFDDLSDEEKDLIRMARRKGLRPKDLTEALLTTQKVKSAPAREESSSSGSGDDFDLVKMMDKMQKKALEMKMNLAIMNQLGLNDNGGSSNDIKELIKEMNSKQEQSAREFKETIKEILEEKHEKGDKISPSEMMNMVIMLKALGGEKSNDWKDFWAAAKELNPRSDEKDKGNIDPLALIDKMQEIQSRAKQEDMQLLAQTQPMKAPGEGEETLDKFISKETMGALRENIANNIKEVFNPQKKLVDDKGKVDVGNVVEKIVNIVGDTIKRIPVQAPPPKSTEEFERPPIDTTGEVVGNEAQNQQEGSGEAPPPPPPPPPQEPPAQQQPPQQQQPKLPIEGQGQ